MSRSLAAALYLVLLPSVGIAGAPDVYVPSPDEAYEVPIPGELTDDPWWAEFDDPLLSAVMAEGLANNHDLGAAWARVVQAKAMSWSSLAPMLPRASFDLGVNMSPTKSLGFQFGGFPSQPGTDRPDQYYTGSAMVNVAVPLDITGRSYLSWRASRFDAMAQEGDHDAQALAISAALAGAYFDLVSAREQLTIAETQVQASRDMLELIELQYEKGSASALDVLQQRQQLAGGETMVPQARVGLRRAESQLGVLLGRSPAEALPEVAASLPDLPPTPPTGVPADLLVRRPDLRSAEARLDSAERRKASAFTALLPTFKLTGQAGWQYTKFDEWDSQDTWGVGASASVPIFGGGQTWSAIQQAGAGVQMAEHAYGQGVLMAVSEVETALGLEADQQAVTDATMSQLEAARLTYEESKAQYLAGLTPYVSVLVSVNTLQQAELTDLQARRALVGARIQLHDALGGAPVGDPR